MTRAFSVCSDKLAGFLFHIVVKVAADIVSVSHILPLRHLGLALLHALRAARVELAARRRIGRRGNASLQDDALHLRLRIRNRNRGEQGLRVGVQRIREQLFRRAELHDIAEVHDADRVLDVLDLREVMRDKEIAQVVLLL